MWTGNTGALADGTPVIFDPAVYFGDREVDIAMSKMFGELPDAFYEAYEDAWPLHPGHRQRLVVYNLYHELNHYVLFGGGYKQQSIRSIDRILAFK